MTIGVVAHHQRSCEAKLLAKKVNADFISIDNGTLGCDDNHEAVASHLSNLPATWSIILEDDAQPVDDFRTHAQQALTMSPAPIVSFYTGRQKPSHWQPRYRRALHLASLIDASWLISTHLIHAVGYAIKTDLLASLLDHTTDLPVDQHISNWARYHGHTVAYTIPSLTDHADWPTLINHPDGQPRTPGRTAWTVGTRTSWTTKSVVL